MDHKIGDVVVITNWDICSKTSHYIGEISVIDRIEEPYYYLINDDTTPFTKEQISLIGNKENNMIKCKKCNSTNIKVDFDKVYTSIPAQYGYCCQDCGEHGYVSEYEISNSKFDSEGCQIVDNNIIETPEENSKGGMMGWICPKCGRCYSPYTSMCSFCNNNNWNITCSETSDILNTFKK